MYFMEKALEEKKESLIDSIYQEDIIILNMYITNGIA